MRYNFLNCGKLVKITIKMLCAIKKLTPIRIVIIIINLTSKCQ